jgi:hypothetical protein
MRGETVIVRAFGGKPLLKKVWSVGARVVYLLDETDLEKMLAGGESVQPIGFPKEDVFKYDAAMAGILSETVWPKLIQWTP